MISVLRISQCRQGKFAAQLSLKPPMKQLAGLSAKTPASVPNITSGYPSIPNLCPFSCNNKKINYNECFKHTSTNQNRNIFYKWFQNFIHSIFYWHSSTLLVPLVEFDVSLSGKLVSDYQLNNKKHLYYKDKIPVILSIIIVFYLCGSNDHNSISPSLCLCFLEPNGWQNSMSS